VMSIGGGLCLYVIVKEAWTHKGGTGGEDG
jgi:hypothetical protein